MKKLGLSLLLWVFVFPSFAQKNIYERTLKIKGVRDSVSYLAYYLGDLKTQIPVDTSTFDSEGKVVFSGSKAIPDGVYLVTAGKTRLMDIVIIDSEPKFLIESDTTHLISHASVKNSYENTVLYDYLTLVRKIQTTPAPKTPKERSEFYAQQQKTVEDYFSKHASSLAVKFLRGFQNTDIPPTIKDSTQMYHYYINHYFDFVDFSDERMLRTPLYHNKIDYFMDKVIAGPPDSLIKFSDKIIHLAKNKEVQKYLIRYLTGKFESSKVLGQESVMLHLFENYFINEPTLWDSSTVSRIRERVAILKPLMPGKKLPNLALQDFDAKDISLHTIKAKNTFVFFYDPDCHHCKESTPKLLKIAQDRKKDGLVVLAVDASKDEKKWRKFVEEQKINPAFINAFDQFNVVSLHKQYDVYSTPTTYLLDENKNIIARKLPVEELEKYLYEFYPKYVEQMKKRKR